MLTITTVSLVLLILASGRGVAQGDVAADGQGAAPDALSETWRAWTVTCGSAMPAADPPVARDCRMSQDLRRQPDGQRILAVTVRTSDATAVATFVAPFGLDLAHGLDVGVDDAPPVVASFATCLPAGCIAHMDLDPAALAALRAGQTVTVAMHPLGTAEPITVTLPLDGFADTIARLGELE